MVTAAARALEVVAIAADTQADTPVEVTAVVDIPAVAAVAVPVEVVLPDDNRIVDTFFHRDKGCSTE